MYCSLMARKNGTSQYVPMKQPQGKDIADLISDFYIVCLAEDTRGYNPRIMFSGNQAQTDKQDLWIKINNKCESCIGLC